MRRILCFALAAVMILSLAACGEKTTKEETTDAATAAATEASTDAATEQTPKTEAPTAKAAGGRHDVISLDFIKKFDQKPSLEEQSVYKKDGLTITAKSLRYDTVNGPQIMLGIRNDSDSEVLIQNDYTVVNGFMMKPDLNAKVAAHKKLETPMSLPYLGLAMANIHSLRELEISLRILDSKTFEVKDTTDTVQLKLNDVSDKQTKPDESGQTAYDDKGVKVIIQGVKKDTLFDCASVLTVYMMNSTNKTISVKNTKLSVNGYDITTAMHTVILPGKRAVDKIELFDSELDEYGVTSLDSVEVAFEINDYEKWEVMATSDTLSVVLPTEPPTEKATTAPTEAATEK